MQVLKNVKAYVDGKITKCDIAFENGIIKAIGANLDMPNAEEITVGENSVVCPGFIDEHIHGAAGADGMDGTEAAIATIANAIASEGTTGFLVTTMTQSETNIKNALSAVNRYIGGHFDGGAAVLGVHLEGPFISKKHVGAQPIEYVQAPSVAAFKEYEEASGGHIKIVSLAPEENGATELIRYLASKNIVASIGHTDAKYKDVVAAIGAGAKSVTHTYNAQTPLHHREVGVVGSALLEDELNAELIADCIHVCPEAMKILYKSKPADKLTLITDAMRAKHLPDGVSELGGQTVYVKNGEARLKDGTLAGSVLKMNEAVKNLVLRVGVPFERAIDCATINPAKNLSLDRERGSITVGKVADFAVLESDFSVEKTIRDGKVIYEAK
mgnify:CR=1 FL=1